VGELIEAGIPVPPGFAVASSAFEATGLGPQIDRRLAGVDAEDTEGVRGASADIAALVRGAPVPDPVRAEIEDGYAALADGAPAVAVRSSAVGEDSAAATFAGQQETFLWVRGGDRVCEAVRDCWASLYSPEAISYRARMGDPGRGPAMGVAVQLMVDARVSGVMFTCNPVTGDPSTVAVNASWGLGLAVVGGEVTPDEYRVSKVTGEVLQRTIGPKQVEYLPDPAGGGTVRVDVPADRQAVACLDDEQLAALLEIGRRVESHFGGHQDVEWALAGDGTLHLLQSRPVTVAPAKPAPAGPRSAMDLVMGTFGVRKGT
jgi:pyruvate,water dikinase